MPFKVQETGIGSDGKQDRHERFSDSYTLFSYGLPGHFVPSNRIPRANPFTCLS